MQQTHADTNSDVNIVSQDVGLIFVREYYTFLNKQPHRLHAFYSKDSVLVRGDEGESAQTHRGQEEIRGKIEELGFEDCKVLVTQVDSQTSANEGIIIQVLGEMCNKDEPSQKFSQTFFLARQSNGYYVLNDIFRFLKDEVNIDYYTCEDDEAQHQQQLEQQKIKAQEEQQQQQQKKKLEEAAELKKKAQEEKQKKAAATAAAAASAISTAAKSETAAVPAQENRPKETKPAVAAEKSTPPVMNQVKDKKESSEEKEKKGPVQVNGVSSPVTSPATEVNGKDHHQQQAKNVKPESEKKQQPVGPAKSSGPKTWANMAASSKWSASVNTTPSQAPKQPGSPLQQPQQQQQQQQQQQPQPQQQQQPQPQQQQQQQNQHQHQAHPQQGGHQHGHGSQRREDTQIFIKNINQSINEENLREAFSQFGTVKAVNVVYNRNCAFLDFTSTDSVHKALSQHKVNVHNNVVLAEERRHNSNTGGNRYQNNRQQQNNRPYDNRRFQQDGHRRGGGPRGGKSRGGGGGAGGGSNSGTNNGPKQ
ncbi:hypothetical protein BDC45DRAFT_602912 [Circinella umbellata]|nr:hypothetical protein BDC45DRAFT_602912 [Circinella umbellata]